MRIPTEAQRGKPVVRGDSAGGALESRVVVNYWSCMKESLRGGGGGTQMGGFSTWAPQV